MNDSAKNFLKILVSDRYLCQNLYFTWYLSLHLVVEVNLCYTAIDVLHVLHNTEKFYLLFFVLSYALHLVYLALGISLNAEVAFNMPKLTHYTFYVKARRFFFCHMLGLKIFYHCI